MLLKNGATDNSSSQEISTIKKVLRLPQQISKRLCSDKLRESLKVIILKLMLDCLQCTKNTTHEPRAFFSGSVASTSCQGLAEAPSI